MIEREGGELLLPPDAVFSDDSSLIYSSLAARAFFCLTNVSLLEVDLLRLTDFGDLLKAPPLLITTLTFRLAI